MKYLCKIVLLFICSPLAICSSLEPGFYYTSPGFFSSWTTPECCQMNTDWSFDIYGGYTMGRYIGLKENYFQAGTHIASPPYKEYQPLIEMKAYRLDDGHWASSLGVGLRWPNAACDQVWGANLFYDFRATDPGNFNRIGVGFELLTNYLDYCLNLYLPLQSERSKTHQHKELPKCQYDEHRYIPSGLDFILSMPLLEWDDFEVVGAAGPYYYYNKNVDHIFGAQAAVELNWTEYVACEARVSYDNKFKANAQGTIILRLPLSDLLCEEALDTERQRILQPIQRSGVIFDIKKTGDWY